MQRARDKRRERSHVNCTREYFKELLRSVLLFSFSITSANGILSSTVHRSLRPDISFTFPAHRRITPYTPSGQGVYLQKCTERLQFRPGESFRCTSLLSHRPPSVLAPGPRGFPLHRGAVVVSYNISTDVCFLFYFFLYNAGRRTVTPRGYQLVPAGSDYRN